MLNRFLQYLQRFIILNLKAAWSNADFIYLFKQWQVSKSFNMCDFQKGYPSFSNRIFGIICLFVNSQYHFHTMNCKQTLASYLVIEDFLRHSHKWHGIAGCWNRGKLMSQTCTSQDPHFFIFLSVRKYSVIQN